MTKPASPHKSGTMDPAKTKLRVIAASVIFLIVLTTAYFSAYALLGKRGTISGPTMNGEAQFFRYKWQAAVFGPAANVESAVFGKNVYVQQWDAER
jgi:hypothetical protein